MRLVMGMALAAVMAPGAAIASPLGEKLPDLLYAGTATAERDAYATACDEGDAEACFGVGLIDLILTAEGFSQALYRHGATAPDMPAAAMLLGIGEAQVAASGNPDPEPLTYDGLRQVLDDFVGGLDQAQQGFVLAAEFDDDFVLLIDPLRVRLDLNGDGTSSEGETLALLLRDAIELPQGKTKDGRTAPVDTTIGFDRADALWFAGYTQITAAPVDLLLAHDFSQFFDAALHRVFPRAGLPMQDFSKPRGTLMMDAESDGFIADMIAAIHTASFPVEDSARLAGVLERMRSVTALSRRNWEAILAETDDNRELVPSPAQTSLVPGMAVTQEIVDAWMETLDTVDQILAGDLLIPHWRFRQGFSLPAYFETATETDLIMLLTGQGALPFLRDGPVADEQSFVAGNRVFGDNWPNFIVWFN
ncbi:hypothetical protein DEVEQU_00993 [Devosia equisanguinis]|uniref:Uncharacterized protein n=1 Tax=Devosia equisanguinis TaxID=2490941 RepID=A0A447I8X5_9HYPH|nr:hypothetical protein [Devosia equisanguinis]VDS03864.1 hypothetical protein DEVEQU_00993 [Devosia equisanguinis]